MPAKVRPRTIPSRPATARLAVTLLATLTLLALPAGARAQAVSPPPANLLDAGGFHSCAVLTAGALRCWGFNGDGQLGYGNRATIGDDEAPVAAGPVGLGAGRTAQAVTTGDFHTCALLDDGNVRCWGYAFDGQLGYGNRNNIGDDESPAAAGPVQLGGRAVAISAGGRHTCAILEDGSVRCWGHGGFGQLGYGTTNNVGDGGRGQNDTPASAGAVALPGVAVMIAAGGRHTCALLADVTVRCWGYGASGQLGYGTTTFVSAPSQVGAVDVGAGRSVTAITAGDEHTCAILDDLSVRCWGFGADGRLGYGTTADIGDNELPSASAPVPLGGNVTAIRAGGTHTCALLGSGAARCWGLGLHGRLGLGATVNIGDDEAPSTTAPLSFGADLVAETIAPGRDHTCARLIDRSVRCWGYSLAGRLGRCAPGDIGDDELPSAVAPVDVEAQATPCARPPAVSTGDGGGGGGGFAPLAPVATPDAPAPAAAAREDDGLSAESRRAAGLRRCLARAARTPRRRRAAARSACRKRHGRTPGRVRGLRARATSGTRIVLSFSAPGSDGGRPPAARTYIVKQSRRPIRDARSFTRAQALCGGSCRFAGARIGTTINLTITRLRPGTTYHFAVAARDNVSHRAGPRSPSVRVRTR